MKPCSLRSKVLLYEGMSSWHFLSVPKEASATLRERYGKNARGWGSLPVHVTIGKTSWDTSIFPDKRSGTYLLPLKLAVRQKEGIAADDVVLFSLTMRA